MTRPTNLAPTRDRDEVVTPCIGHGPLFDSNLPEEHAAAKAICATCPFIAECDQARRDVITDYPDVRRYGGGTWAGKLIGPTQRPRPTLVTPEGLAPCGTMAAYRRHRNAGEKACQPCQDAASAVWAERWQRRAVSA